MNILIAAAAAVIFYIALCCTMNRYFETGIKLPGSLIYSEKNITIICAAEAVISCTGLYFGTDSNSFFRLILFYVLCIFLAAAALIDIKKRIIPNRLVFILFCVWILYIVIMIIISSGNGVSELINSITGAVFSMFVFGIGYLLMKNKLGGGDVKLTVVMGLILTGDAIFGALMYALVLSLIFAAIALISKKMTIKDSMPFAPFLFLGTAAAIAVM